MVLVAVPEDSAVSLQVGQEELGVGVTGEQVPQTGETRLLHLPHTLHSQGPLDTHTQDKLSLLCSIQTWQDRKSVV